MARTFRNGEIHNVAPSQGAEASSAQGASVRMFGREHKIPVNPAIRVAVEEIVAKTRRGLHW